MPTHSNLPIARCAYWPLWASLFVLVTTLVPVPAAAQTLFDKIGYTDLVTQLGAGVPTGDGVGVTMVEAMVSNPSDTRYIPDETNAEFNTATITVQSGGNTSPSGHATLVGRHLFGDTTSIATGISQVEVWEVNHFLGGGFLGTGTNQTPSVQTANHPIQNHSWIGTYGSGNTALDIEALQRLDFAIKRDNFVAVVGVNNGNSTVLPMMLGQSYNTLAVGRSDGLHSHGFTTIDGAGRIKPDIVAPLGATSYATPVVASAAALLWEAASDTPVLNAAKKSEVIRALLLAGATKNEFAGVWDRTTARPLDDVYGAGELNIARSYNTLAAGRQPTNGSTPVSSIGWDHATTGASSKVYHFTVQPGTVLPEFSTVLNWNRTVTDEAPGPFFEPGFSGLEDLNLALYRTSGSVLSQQLDFSASAVDNVEHVYLNDNLGMGSVLWPGTYAMEVSSSETGVPFALAWFSQNVVSPTWTSTAATGNWTVGSNWLAGTAPATDTYVLLDNTNGSMEQSVDLDISASLRRLRIAGTDGPMFLDVTSEDVLSVSSGIEIQPGGGLAGYGLILSDVVNDGTLVIGSRSGPSAGALHGAPQSATATTSALQAAVLSATAPASAVISAVPEPTSLGLVAGVLMSLSIARHCRRHKR